MATPYLSVIIPSYNEARRIPLTLIDIDRHLSQAKFSYEILVVDDGSNDTTREIVEKMAKTIRHLKLVHFKQNRGKGAVVRDGMLMAKGRIRLFTDADNSTSINHFYSMMPHFKAGYDVVMCSRAHKESSINPAQSLIRRMSGKCGNLIIQALVLPGFWDTQCGFKAFSERAAEEIFSRTKINGWGFDAEALALAHRAGYRIKEIPVVWAHHAVSCVSSHAYLQTLFETVTIRWWLWAGIYGTQNVQSTRRIHRA